MTRSFMPLAIGTLITFLFIYVIFRVASMGWKAGEE